MEKIKTLSIDLETFSDIDLAKCGVYRYVESPAFEILLFGVSVNGGDVMVYDLAQGEKISNEILAALTDSSVTKWAFNAAFERVCLSKYLGLPSGEYLDPTSWRCSMIWSAYMGLPLSLAGTGSVLGLPEQKLKEGKELIKYFCVPCAPTKANGGRMRNLPRHAPEKWAQFKAYNKRDVEVEMSIQDRLRKFPVPDFLWEEYCLDQQINDRGIALDMAVVENAILFDENSRGVLSAKMQELTALENPNSVQQMKQWLSENGLKVDSLGKKEVAAILKTAPPQLAEVLELRQQLAKSSVKKYQAMRNAVCSDGRAHGMFQFYGANRSGRWAGRLIQFRVPVEKHGVNGHLRQKGKIAELALGYGGSVGALKAMGALEMGLSEDELQPLVDMWRSSNPNIVRFWWEIDRCVKDTIRQRLRTDTHGIQFEYQSGMLFITLPSGRRLSYVKPRIGENKFGGESVTYEGVGATKKWERVESYGPKFVENIVQAVSRDILCYAMRTLRNYRICGHVHDELIIECPEDTNVAEICEMMGRTPPWSAGLPLRADGYECVFYKKD